MELQARWAAMVFSGRIPPPNSEHPLLIRDLADERALRALPHELQPTGTHLDYAGFSDSIAFEIGALPYFTDLQINNPILFDKLMKTPPMSAHYGLFGPHADPAWSLKQIDLVFQYMQECMRLG